MLLFLDAAPVLETTATTLVQARRMKFRTGSDYQEPGRTPPGGLKGPIATADLGAAFAGIDKALSWRKGSPPNHTTPESSEGDQQAWQRSEARTESTWLMDQEDKRWRGEVFVKVHEGVKNHPRKKKELFISIGHWRRSTTL